MEKKDTKEVGKKLLTGSTTILDYLSQKLHLLSYANLMEYAVPAFVLTVLLTVDYWVLVRNSNISAISDYVQNSRYLNAKVLTITPVFIFLGGGYGMYLSKYYHYFPTFRSKKRIFFNRLAGFAKNDLPKAYKANRYRLGKKMYRVVWEHLMDEEETKKHLFSHAKWVCLMQNAVNFIVSTIFISIAFIFNVSFFYSDLKMSYYVLNLSAIVLHFAMIYYLSRAAFAWQRTTNRAFNDKVNRDKEKIIELIPENFHTYINDALNYVVLKAH